MLTFEEKINLTASAASPAYVSPLFIGHEPDKDVYQYYLDGFVAGEKKATWDGLQPYADLSWGDPTNIVSRNRVEALGIKSFPKIGAIGFFKPIYSSSYRILAPIHTRRTRLESPTLQCKVSDQVHFTIVPPKDITYMCYRIVMRWGYFAIEYITYDLEFIVDKPITTGTYECYCIGYLGENDQTSDISNIVPIEIEGSQDNWPGPQLGADIYPTSAVFLPDGKLQINLSNSTKITTSNAATNDVYVTESELTKVISEAITKGGFVTTETMNQAIKESGHVTTEEFKALDGRVDTLEQLLVAAEALVDEINGEVV